jgi:RimJ/RimL family protein N-acetyltransferase
MNRPLLQGELIQLTAVYPEMDAEWISKWSQDSVYDRLMGIDPARPSIPSKTREEFEKMENQENHATRFSFAIRTLAENRLIGLVFLEEITYPHQDAWIALGIGEREFWDQGYGTDAMREALRFGFEELNLHRISLTVFEYNTRAMRSYQKVGFRMEGRARKYLNRDGRRWDLIYMGILQKEWRQINAPSF